MTIHMPGAHRQGISTRSETRPNLARYYRIKIVRGLFGDWGLVRAWGRIGRAGHSRTDWFGTEGAFAGECEILRQG